MNARVARTDGSRGRVRRAAARAALIVASLCVSLLVMEAVLRVAFPHWRGLVAQRFMTMTEDGVLAGVPGFEGRISSLFGDFDVPLQLDAYGFRNPPDADRAAPLAFVGDSFCQGWGVTREQSFPTLAAARLGTPFYNYCTTAADLLDDLKIVRTWMPHRRGRTTVLTVTFENDVLAYPDSAGEAPSAAVQGLSRSALSHWLMDHSALFDVATTLARQNATIVGVVRRLGLMSGLPVVEAAGIPASVRMVERIRHAAGEGPFVVLLVPPRPGQVELIDYGAFVTALVAAGLDVIDPSTEPNLVISTIPYDGHWDAATHAAVASLLAERIKHAGAPAAG